MTHKRNWVEITFNPQQREIFRRKMKKFNFTQEATFAKWVILNAFRLDDETEARLEGNGEAPTQSNDTI